MVLFLIPYPLLIGLTSSEYDLTPSLTARGDSGNWILLHHPQMLTSGLELTKCRPLLMIIVEGIQDDIRIV